MAAGSFTDEEEPDNLASSLSSHSSHRTQIAIAAAVSSRNSEAASGSTASCSALSADVSRKLFSSSSDDQRYRS